MTRVDVFADIVCPFAYVGLDRLVAERDRRGRTDIVFVVRAWPLELVNGQPVDPHFIGEEIEDLRAQVAGDLFTDFDEHVFPGTSLPGLALTAAAYEVDDVTGEAVAMELRRELFERRHDVADPDILAAVARRHGVALPADTEAAVADWHAGQERGVVGSPHFFAGDRSLFCPSLDIAREGEHLRVRVDPAGFEEILAAVFG